MGELRLVPVGSEHLAVIERLTGDPAAAGEHAWPGWQDPRRYRRRWDENRLLDPDGGALLALRGEEPVGFVTWRRQPTGPGQSSYCWNIGIGILPEARGRGYGGEAQRLLAEYLFAHTLVNRVEAVTEVANTAEQRALRKAGFTREGTLRGYAFRDGEWRDGVVFSILRSEIAT